VGSPSQAKLNSQLVRAGDLLHSSTRPIKSTAEDQMVGYGRTHPRRNNELCSRTQSLRRSSARLDPTRHTQTANNEKPRFGTLRINRVARQSVLPRGSVHSKVVSAHGKPGFAPTWAMFRPFNGPIEKSSLVSQTSVATNKKRRRSWLQVRLRQFL
jgi:hypothetical protein